MNRKIAAALALASLALWGCNLKSSGDRDPGDHHGRYSGVGIYGPSRQWTKLIGAQQVKDSQLARLIDDQVIIVVQDSTTGEVRACGDLTGYCIGMNPWKTALLSSQITPIKLSEHRAPDEPDATVELTAKPSKPHKVNEKDEKPSAGH